MINNTLIQNTPIDSCPVFYDSYTQKLYSVKDGIQYEIQQVDVNLTEFEIDRLREIMDWFQRVHRPEEIL